MDAHAVRRAGGAQQHAREPRVGAGDEPGRAGGGGRRCGVARVNPARMDTSVEMEALEFWSVDVRRALGLG